MKTIKRENWKDFLSIYGPGLVFIALGLYVTQHFIKPAPPREVTIATGQSTGAYYQYAKQYARHLESEGITLHIRETAGSVENINLLQNGEVDIAFLQSGTIPQNNPKGLEGLASLYYEPLWMFHQKGLQIERLGQLQKRKVSIGAEGSGTSVLVRRLLNENELDGNKLKLLNMDDSEALDKLKSGQIDAAFFVTRPGTPLIKELMAEENISLTSFQRAAGYTKRFYYLSALTLPEGSLDFVKNIPDQDIKLISTTASLAVDPNIHPAIVDLIMQAADSAHHSPGWFEDDKQFPSPKYLELPLNDQADSYFTHGPPFLQRYMPFWAASMIDRLKIMLLPVVLLMIPVIKIMPPLYQWRMRTRILKLYNELEMLDYSGEQMSKMNPKERNHVLEKLTFLDRDAQDLKVPTAFSGRLYDLRQHIALVKKDIMKLSVKKS